MCGPAQSSASIVRGHPLLRQRTDRPRVSTGREAQVCLRHTVGVTLIDGAAGVAQYTDAKVADAAIRALGDRVVIEEDTSIPVEAARVTIELASGGRETAYVAHARGSLGRPLSDREIEDKLRTLAASNAPAVEVSRLIDAVWALDQSPDSRQAHAARRAAVTMSGRAADDGLGCIGALYDLRLDQTG